MERSNHKKPFVSVIIATYNYGPFIEEAIESVLTQTFPQNEIEIIVIDDGSTDNTTSRIKKYKDRIQYIYKKNGGQASAFNTGFEKVRGEIIAFLDSDDYWDNHKIEITASKFEQSRFVDFVYHDLNIVDNKGDLVTTYFKRTYPNLTDEMNDKHQEIELDRYLRGQSILPFPPTSGLSMRVECLRNIMPVPEHYRVCADTYLHFFTLFYAVEGFLITEPLGYYRFHGSNITEDGSLLSGNKMSTIKLKQLINVYNLLINDIERYGRDTNCDTSQLRAEFKSWVISWEVDLYPSTYVNAKLILKTHYKILKDEGLKRYLLYSYRYRKGQVFDWIKKNLWA